jgi:hypothetical protein
VDGRRQRTRLRRFAFVALALLAGLITLLALQSPRGAAVRAQSEQVRATQSVWLVTSAHLQDGTGAMTDLAEGLRNAVATQLDPPVQLSPTLSYQKSEAVGARATAADGSTLASIGMQLGLLTVSNSDGSTASVVAALATPNLSERAVTLGPQSRVAIDLSSLPAAQAGETADISYAFLQLLAQPNASSEAGLSDEQLLEQRYQTGNAQLLSTTDVAGNEAAALTPPLPLALQASELATATPATQALYLRTGQSGGVEGVFDALGALNLDPAQLLPVAATPRGGELPALSVIRAVASGSTAAGSDQAIANNSACPPSVAQSCGGGLPTAGPTDAPTSSPSPSPSPSPTPTPPPADCDLEQGCDFYGEGVADWDSHFPGDPFAATSYEIRFDIQISPTLIPNVPVVVRASGAFVGSNVTSGSDCLFTNLMHGDIALNVDDINNQLPTGATVKFDVVQSSAQVPFTVTCKDPASTTLHFSAVFPRYTLDYLPLANHGAASGRLADAGLLALGNTGSIEIEVYYLGPYQTVPSLPPAGAHLTGQRR